MGKLTPAEVREHLQTVPDWRERGNAIARTFELRDFAAAMKFVNAVAQLAEKAWHHPDIDIRWNKVTLDLSTHSESGLTEQDFALAIKVDRVFAKTSADKSR